LTTGLDKWLYFLRHAEKMDTENLPPELASYPLIPRAVEELKMLNQTELEHHRYESRRKALMDYNSGLIGERREALKEGELIGQIPIVFGTPVAFVESTEILRESSTSTRVIG